MYFDYAQYKQNVEEPLEMREGIAFKKYFDSNEGEIIESGPSGGITKVADLKIDGEKAVKFIN